jgi:hypothetical protein
MKETVTWLRELWGPMRFDIEDEIAEGDKVVISDRPCSSGCSTDR